MVKPTVSRFFCTSCGNEGLPVLRTNKKIRPPGHLKKMYCLTCGREVNMAEVRGFIHSNNEYTKEDFDIEFKYHNFDAEGNRIVPWRQFVSKYKN